MSVWIVGAFVILKMGASGAIVFDHTAYVNFDQCKAIGVPQAIESLKQQQRDGVLPEIHHVGIGCFKAIQADKKVL